MTGRFSQPRVVSPRDPGQDILKALAIILVVFGHILRGNLFQPYTPLFKALDFVVYTTHMPIFFLVAGYNLGASLSRHPTRAFLKSRWGALAYPYFFWSLAFVFLQGLGGTITTINHPRPMSDAMSILWRPYSIFWFLYALFAMQLLTLAFKARPAAFLTFSIAASALASAYGAPSDIVVLTGAHLPFFAIGYFLFHKCGTWHPVSVISPAKTSLAFLVFVVGNILANSYGAANPVSLITLPLSLAGVVLLIHAALLTQKGPPRVAQHFASIGAHSFQIYILHIFFLPMILRALPHLGIHARGLQLIITTCVGIYGPLYGYALVKKMGLQDFLALSGKAPHLKSSAVTAV